MPPAAPASIMHPASSRIPSLAALCAGVFALLGAAPSAPGQGARRFRKHTLAYGFPFASLVIADFNRDGRPDVATAATEEVALFAGGARPAFWKKTVICPQTAETGTLTCNDLSGGDVDADGDTDLLAHTGGTGHLVWYRNPAVGGGEWQRLRVDVLKNPHGTAWEDLDRDGRPELVAVQEGSIVWYWVPRGPAVSGPWERRMLAPDGVDGIAHHLAFADLDGDGDRDVATGASTGGYVAWWEHPGDLSRPWKRHLVRSLPGASHALPADLDADGKPDLLYAVGHGKGLGWLSGPAFREEHPIDDGWLDNPHSPCLEDLDGDRDLDLACAGRLNDRVAWWENDGRGRFQRHDLDEGQPGLDLRAADLDGDGDTDLVLAGENRRNLVWYESLLRPSAVTGGP